MHAILKTENAPDDGMGYDQAAFYSYLKANSSDIVIIRQSMEIERPIFDTTERAKFGAYTA